MRLVAPRGRLLQVAECESQVVDHPGFLVARRTSEIGVRMALGANRGDVVGMVMRGAFSQVLLGLAVGVPIALLGARVIAAQLYGVRAYDPLSLLIAAALLAAAQ